MGILFWWSSTTKLEPILRKTPEKHKPRLLAHASVRCALPRKPFAYFLRFSPPRFFLKKEKGVSGWVACAVSAEAVWLGRHSRHISLAKRKIQREPVIITSMKTIAIDIDNVLAASAESFVVISNKLFGDHITVNDFNEDWQKMWGITHE